MASIYAYFRIRISTVARIEKLASGEFAILGIEREGQWIPRSGQNDVVREGDAIVFCGNLNEMDKSFRSKTNASV